MAVQIPPGFVQCSYRFALGGDNEEMICTMGYNRQGDGPAQANALADEFAAAFFPGWASPAYRFMGVKLQVGQDGGPPTVFTAERNIQGSNGSGAPLPNNVAILIKKLTALGGRKGRGRIYLPPMFPMESNITDQGGLSGADVVAIRARCLEAFGPPLMVPHLLHDVQPGAPALPPTPIIDFVCDSRVATQRRRLRR